MAVMLRSVLATQSSFTRVPGRGRQGLRVEVCQSSSGIDDKPLLCKVDGCFFAENGNGEGRTASRDADNTDYVEFTAFAQNNVESCVTG